MTSAHHFIDISQNILNLWMRLIFPETRHLGLQFKHKDEAIPIRIESDHTNNLGEQIQNNVTKLFGCMLG